MSRPEPTPAPSDEREPGAARATARARRALDAASAVLLVAACGAPAVGALLRPGAAAESVVAEQRKPAPAPQLPRSPRAAAKLPREFKAWHDDHLGLRDVMLEARSQLLLHGLGLSPTSSAVIGDDGWLWFAGESSLAAWRGAAPLEPSQVESWRRVFRDRAAWCRARGIAYVAALAPNKMEVYPERVPPPFEKIGPSRYDQISAALAAEPAGWYLDLRAELSDERRNDTAEDFTYSRRGTHWTARAALRGAVAMMTMARAAGVDVELPRRADFEFTPMPFDDDAWSGQLHLPDLPKEVQPVLSRNLARRWRPTAHLDGVPKRVETVTGVADLPRMWVVHDSFGAALRPLLAPFFSRITFDWRNLGEFEPAQMVEFAPHVVLDVHTERQIFRPAPELIASRDESELAGRFERAGAPVWTLANSAARAVAGGSLRCTVEDEGLVLHVSGRGGNVSFSDADLDVPGTPILRLALEAEHAASVYVQCQVHGRSGWQATPSVERALAGGAQEVLIEFLDPRSRGPIRITVPPEAGVVRVRSAEIRDARW